MYACTLHISLFVAIGNFVCKLTFIITKCSTKKVANIIDVHTSNECQHFQFGFALQLVFANKTIFNSASTKEFGFVNRNEKTQARANYRRILSVDAYADVLHVDCRHITATKAILKEQCQQDYSINV